MKENSSTNESELPRFLSQVKVFDKTISLEEFKNRQLALEESRNLLSSLIEEDFIIEEGSMEIMPLIEKKIEYEIPDFIVQKEDIRFLVFIETERERYIIDREKWYRISINFDEKPITAIILSWFKKDMNSCALDQFSRRKYLEIKDEEISFENEAFSPLCDCIKEFYNIQFVDWKISEDLTKLIVSQERVLIKDLLSEKFMFYLKQLKETNFRIKEKIKAQSLINKKDFEDILNFLYKFLAKKKIERLDNKEIDKFITRLIE
ncbi:hypothetical protein ES703_32774 [subsurface metagenome]